MRFWRSCEQARDVHGLPEAVARGGYGLRTHRWGHRLAAHSLEGRRRDHRARVAMPVVLDGAQANPHRGRPRPCPRRCPKRRPSSRGRSRRLLRPAADAGRGSKASTKAPLARPGLVEQTRARRRPPMAASRDPKVTRRDALRLATAVGALGAGLGVTLKAGEALAGPNTFKEVQLKEVQLKEVVSEKTLPSLERPGDRLSQDRLPEGGRQHAAPSCVRPDGPLSQDRGARRRQLHDHQQQGRGRHDAA